jgi:hypothetical protein
LALSAAARKYSAETFAGSFSAMTAASRSRSSHAAHGNVDSAEVDARVQVVRLELDGAPELTHGIQVPGFRRVGALHETDGGLGLVEVPLLDHGRVLGTGGDENRETAHSNQS